MADDESNSGITKTFLAVIALIPALATAITGYLAYQINSEIQGVRIELEKIENQRAFDLEIYKAVKEALKGSAKDQQVALALVVSIGEDPLKAALLATLEEAPSAAPDVVAEARNYRELDKQVERQPQGGETDPEQLVWADWDFDLFFCETSGEPARAQATLVANALEDDGAEGRIRVRPLSADKNREAGYRIKGYAIRRSDDETAMADKLAAFANATLQHDGVQFEVQRASQKSPWYISVFLCPA